MKFKILLFIIPFIAVFFLSSQNANAYCTYSNPVYATMTPLDKVAFKNCVNFYPQSACDSSCGSFFLGCDGTKIKAKDITSCVAGSPFYPCGWLTNSFQEGYTYTYKDCGGEPVRNKCYGGACVECISNTDCSGGKTCQSNLCACPSGTIWDGTQNKCVVAGPIGCTNPSSYSNSNNCQSAGCAWCAPPTYSGYCAASSGDCKAPCTKNSDCKNVCDPGGCNLEYMICGIAGVCEPLGKSKFCGMGSSCDS